ncbi:MAG: 30S ribosomal protein S18 [Anaerolineales bacterium]|nr:30S ribosomal protein S18 [Anaerolineales bacterium]
MQRNSSQGRRPPRRRRKICAFCVDGVRTIDYKQSEMLGRYVNEYGRIKPRRQTGTCAKHQRSLAVAVKRARHLALLPFVAE